MSIEVFDDFLPVYPEFNEYARSLSYAGEVNPADGVLYPDINAQVPPGVLEWIRQKTGLEPKTTFFRLTTENTKGAPHQAHTDTVMGEWTFMYYLQDGPGGTSLLRHKATGLLSDPVTQDEYEAWRRDTNTPEAWEIIDMAEMKANRAVLFPSKYMHRAEPIGGFGQDASNGRLVLTSFMEETNADPQGNAR